MEIETQVDYILFTYELSHYFVVDWQRKLEAKTTEETTPLHIGNPSQACQKKYFSIRNVFDHITIFLLFVFLKFNP